MWPMSGAPTLATALRRAARLACPACGRGAVFARPFVRAETCGRCGWRFERGEGHWVGGAEVHMFASYLLSVVFCVPMLFLFGRTPLVMGLVMAGHVVVSLLVFHLSRSLFLGIDYWIDPATAPGGDDDDREGGGVRPRTPPSPARRRAALRLEGSKRAREAVPHGSASMPKSRR